MYNFGFLRSCHTPKWVKVGEFEVFCSGYMLFEENQLDGVDVFVGLGEVWSGYFVHIPRPFERFVGDLNKVIAVPMEDGSVSEIALAIVDRLLKHGFKVGVGCNGGHGRTGWVVGRLIQKYEGLKGVALVKEVRKRLCEKAIESREQFSDLGLNPEEISGLLAIKEAVKAGGIENGGDEGSQWEKYRSESFLKGVKL